MNENVQYRGLTSDIKEEKKPFMTSGTAAFIGGSLWGIAKGAFYGTLFSLLVVAAIGGGTLTAGLTIAAGALIFGIRDGQSAYEAQLYDNTPPPVPEDKPKEKTIFQMLTSQSPELENVPETKFTDAEKTRRTDSQMVR